MTVPWFHETTQPHLFNEWTWTHFAWGIASLAIIRSDIAALAVHTGYELMEGNIFPVAHRDVSLKNHIGDTIAFIVGRIVFRVALETYLSSNHPSRGKGH